MVYFFWFLLSVLSGVKPGPRIYTPRYTKSFNILEVGIRTTPVLNKSFSDTAQQIQGGIQKQSWYKRLIAKRNRKRVVRYSLLISNAALLIVVVAFVAQKPTNTPVSQGIFTTKESSEAVVSPLDELSSADIAVNIARLAHLEEATSVVNKADTVNAQLSISSADDIMTSKPQVIATGLKSRFDITNYTVKEGDTIESIAARFEVTSDTIRWSNNLSGDSVAAGTKLIISPVSGIVYKVASGDTVDSIVTKFSGNKDTFTVFNDIQVGGLPVGEYVVIPGGSPQVVVAAPTVSGVTRSSGFSWGGNQPVYGSNGYDFGYCTWYVANRRAQIGRPIPSNLGNASTWKVLAQRAGFSVGNAPAAGAVIWTPPRDYYGHVGFVESVRPDGSVVISEMNTAGWNVVSSKTLSPAEAARYSYIY